MTTQILNPFDLLMAGRRCAQKPARLTNPETWKGKKESRLHIPITNHRPRALKEYQETKSAASCEQTPPHTFQAMNSPHLFYSSQPTLPEDARQKPNVDLKPRTDLVQLSSQQQSAMLYPAGIKPASNGVDQPVCPEPSLKIILARAMKSQGFFWPALLCALAQEEPKEEQEGSVGDSRAPEPQQEALGLHHVLAEVLGPTEEAAALLH